MSVVRHVARSVAGVSLCAVLLGLDGCGYYASVTAHEAQTTMIGMTEEDILACAGIPAKTRTLDSHVKIFEYQRGRNIGTAASSTLIPVQSVVNIVRDIGEGDGTTCVADFRLVDGKVQDVHYSGDNDMLIGTDGVCSTIVRGCTRRTVTSGSPSNFWKTSAFLQPQSSQTAKSSASAAGGVPENTAIAPPLAMPAPVAGTEPDPGTASAPVAASVPTAPAAGMAPSAPGSTPAQGTVPASAAPSASPPSSASGAALARGAVPASPAPSASPTPSVSSAASAPVAAASASSVPSASPASSTPGVLPAWVTAPTATGSPAPPATSSPVAVPVSVPTTSPSAPSAGASSTVPAAQVPSPAVSP
ncbi:hypothetical protein OQ252_09645 [Acetobacter farinalis]|uniref:Lipoprotein n=1 Tax=Acetobacter farinalis TaxID=1260984 RepID=A0ABT3Q8P7_9PROT|nr:hypothetical protein [Acetobacter farinalis]MCX2561655.1 hypothetical protein [Acetobacter farinalis]NHO30118.1 hypothetical protein [Acetobacter farinalis]